MAKKWKKMKSKLASGGRGLVVQKPTANVYTVLLFLSLMAILIGCLFLYLEIQEYDGKIKGPAARAWPGPSPAASQLVGTPRPSPERPPYTMT